MGGGQRMCVPEVEAPVMTSVKIVPDDAQFAAELEAAGSKLVVVDFTAEWCGPCKRIAPFYDELSNKFPRAVFLKVDVDVCTETAGAHSVTAMPTFMFFKKGLPIDKMQGADNPALEAKIKEHYEAVGWDGETQSGVKGMIELNTFVSAQGTECLNEDDEHPYSGCLHAGPEFLQSDCDEQLILALAFNQPVKIHSLRFNAPKDKGPKNVRVFMNQPTTIDFNTTGKWRADSIKICQVPKCAKSSTIHKGQSRRRRSDCCGSTSYHWRAPYRTSCWHS